LQSSFPANHCFAVGVTGGAASGKSTVVRLLQEAIGWETCSADAIVHELLATDYAVREEIAAAFGPDVIGPDLSVDRSKLGKIVFASPEKRHTLEAILHPKVREAWRREVRRAQADHSSILVEIPLLFETRAEKFLDLTIVVGCSAVIQLQRLIHNRNLEPERAEGMLAAQMKTEEKVTLADFVLWNDGSTEALQNQARLLAKQFQILAT